LAGATKASGTLRFLTPLAALLVALLLGSPSFAFADAPTGPGWESLREAPVTFHFRKKDRGIAEALAAQTTLRITDIHETAGLPIPAQIDVVLSPTFEQFSAAQPGNPPVWAAGTAYANRSEVYLRTRMPRVGQDPIDQVYVHELVHVLLGRSFREGHPPRWLNEGLARLLAREFRPAEQMEMTRAALAGGLFSLESLTDQWPRGARRASLAYAQSVDFTAYLGDRGEDILARVPSGRRRIGIPVGDRLGDLRGRGFPQASVRAQANRRDAHRRGRPGACSQRDYGRGSAPRAGAAGPLA
jgi:hypothetical protein